MSNRSILGTFWQLQKKHVTTSPNENIKDKIFWEEWFIQSETKMETCQCFHDASYNQPLGKRQGDNPDHSEKHKALKGARVSPPKPCYSYWGAPLYVSDRYESELKPIV